MGIARANDYDTYTSSRANDYDTYSTVTGNLWVTHKELRSNDYDTYSSVTGNIWSTYSTLAGNDYITLTQAQANDLSTYLTVTSNLWTTYQTLEGNIYATHVLGEANDFTTLRSAYANDWAGYYNLTRNANADFFSSKNFRQNVYVHGTLFVFGNTFTATTTELEIANSRFIINDGGTDESAEYGGILVEGTNNNLIGAFLFTTDSQTQWRINGGDLENLGTSENDVATFGFFQANDYATYEILTANTWDTFSKLELNVAVSYANVVRDFRSNDFSTHIAARTNDFITYSTVTGNIYTTFQSLTGNTYTSYQTTTTNVYNTYRTLTANDYATLVAARANDIVTLQNAFANDWATYSNLVTTIRDENVDIYKAPNSINFTGSGVLVTNIGREVTVTIPGDTDRPTLYANDYATYTTLAANDLATLTAAQSNDILTYQAALANDYLTYQMLSTNAYAFISDNVAPSGASVGALWWNSYDGLLYIRYGDEDSEQWVAASPLTTASVEGAAYAFTTINITGQTSITANSVSAQLRFIEGEGITLLTNVTASSITISSTGGGSTFHEFLLAGM